MSSGSPLGHATPADALLADTPLFARVFHHSPVGMIVSDMDGRYVVVNDAFSRMIARPAAALLGHTPVESGLLAAADFPPLLDHLRAADQRAEVPLRLLGGDGQPRHLLASFQRIDIRHRPYAVSLVQDLSEFDRLRDALAQSEQRFRLFFENAPLALVVRDAATNEIVDVNPAACRQYGYSRAEFMTLPSDSLPAAGDAPGPAHHTTADGRALEVEVSTFTFDLAERALNMNALLDVTAQTAANTALRESEHTFRIVSQVSNDGVWDWDLTNGHVWRNNGVQLYGQTPDDPGQPWLDNVHPDDRDRLAADFEQAIHAQEPSWTSEYRVRRPDGGWAKLLQRGVILYEEGRPVRAIGATVDITEPLQVAEAEAQAAQVERDRLARDLHDSVTQSLYSVSLLAEAARRYALAGQETETAEFIARLGDLAQQALRQMRLLVYELRPGVLDQEGLVGALRHRLESVEKRAGIVTTLVIRGERAVPVTLQGEMYHIAHEALNNALRYAAATAVTVCLDTLGDNILLEVIDNGRGFDPGAPHFGRGLATIRERSAHLGGDLSIISTPAQGTTVRLLLPPDLT